MAVTVYPALVGTTNTYYAVRDHLGSVISLVDPTGANKEEYRTDAWGDTAVYNGSYQRIAASAYGNRFAFHGGAWSAATGLCQFRARWYSPELGRWLSPDPIGLGGGLNLYEFCANNPMNFRDPWGLESVWGAAWEGFAGNLAEDGPMNASAGAYGVLRSPWDMLKGTYYGAAGFGSYMGRFVVDPGCTLDDTWDAIRDFDALGALDDWMNNPEAIGSTVGQIGIGIGAAKLMSAGKGAGLADDAFKATGKAQNSASQTARFLQGSGSYPGVDRFRDITLQKGKVVYGGAPGQSAFYTTESGLARAAGSRSSLSQGLQVAPHPSAGYRPGVTAYEVLQDSPAAFGRALANPQHGTGRLPQVVVPDYENVLRPLYSIPLGQ